MAATVEVNGWRAELEALSARLGRLFVRAEPREQAGRYLEGLLGPVKRKNGWQLAEHLGDARPWRMQRVLSHVLWDEEAARDLCRDYAIERHSAPVLSTQRMPSIVRLRSLGGRPPFADRAGGSSGARRRHAASLSLYRFISAQM